MSTGKSGNPSDGGTPVEVDPVGLGERLIIYQGDGTCISVAPAHAGSIAFNPLLEAAGSPIGNSIVWMMVNRTSMRITVESFKMVVLVNDSGTASVATLQRYRLVKVAKIFNALWGVPGPIYSAGIARRTATAGLPQPYAVNPLGGTAARYQAGGGALAMMFRFSTGQLNCNGMQGDSTIIEFVQSRVSIAGGASVFVPPDAFTLPFSPITYLDQGEALALRNVGTSNSNDLPSGVVGYSIDPDLQAGSVKNNRY